MLLGSTLAVSPSRERGQMVQDKARGGILRSRTCGTASTEFDEQRSVAPFGPLAAGENAKVEIKDGITRLVNGLPE